MNCPNDNTTLVMTDRAGIEIDYCPTCRGVWLDRGELDKIIERSERQQPAPDIQNTKPVAGQEYFKPVEQPQRFEGQNYSGYDNRQHSGRKKHRKESFLGDLFDF